MYDIPLKLILFDIEQSLIFNCKSLILHKLPDKYVANRSENVELLSN